MWINMITNTIHFRSLKFPVYLFHNIFLCLVEQTTDVVLYSADKYTKVVLCEEYG